MVQVGDKVLCKDQTIRNKSYFEVLGEKLWLCSKYANVRSMVRIESGPCEINRNIHYPEQYIGRVDKIFTLNQILEAVKVGTGWRIRESVPHVYVRVVLPNGEIKVSSKFELIKKIFDHAIKAETKVTLL